MISHWQELTSTQRTYNITTQLNIDQKYSVSNE